MNSSRLSRRALVVRGVASAAAVGAAFDVVSDASAGTLDGEFVVGRFVRAQGARTGVVSVAGGPPIPVLLNADAFVSHGADGVVYDLTDFVPGEEVVVRGATSERGIAATEFQSVYTSLSGEAVADGAAYALLTPAGRRVHITRAVAERLDPSGLRLGATYSATIWTHPVRGDHTALIVCAARP